MQPAHAIFQFSHITVHWKSANIVVTASGCAELSSCCSFFLLVVTAGSSVVSLPVSPAFDQAVAAAGSAGAVTLDCQKGTVLASATCIMRYSTGRTHRARVEALDWLKQG